MKKKNSKYAILARDKNGKIIGAVEHSFCLGRSETECRVMPWGYIFLTGGYGGKPETYADAKRIQKWSQWLTDEKCFLARVGSKKCPVEILENANTSKYEKRNKPFRLKVDTATKSE